MVREPRLRVALLPRNAIRAGGLSEKTTGFQEHPDIRPEEQVEAPKERLRCRQVQQAGGRAEASGHDLWILPRRG
jgi:hypothetical protein